MRYCVEFRIARLDGEKVVEEQVARLVAGEHEQEAHNGGQVVRANELANEAQLGELDDEPRGWRSRLHEFAHLADEVALGLHVVLQLQVVGASVLRIRHQIRVVVVLTRAPLHAFGRVIETDCNKQTKNILTLLRVTIGGVFTNAYIKSTPRLFKSG